MTALADQIADELDRALASPVSMLLGIDLGQQVADHCQALAPVLADQLVGDDCKLAAQTVIDLMCVLPDPEPRWWLTPLGEVVARSVTGGEWTVSQSEAANLLGVTRGTIAQMAARGTIDADRAGVSVGSLLAVIVRRRAADMVDGDA